MCLWVDTLKKALEQNDIEWHRHALERMLERDISREVVKKVLSSGEIIEHYPDDRPLPSCLMFGRVRGEPFHVVAACDLGSG